jgi:hypothetical protein
LLKLGAGSAVVLLLAGGAVSMVQPGLVQGKLSEDARRVFASVGQAILADSLPQDPGARQIALNGLLERVDGVTLMLPPHAQAELSQLLALLGTAAGRRTLAGLEQDWTTAPLAQVQAALQAMRLSGISLRQQAYQALHDIVGGAYFADASSWAVLGYPGPTVI